MIIEIVVISLSVLAALVAIGIGIYLRVTLHRKRKVKAIRMFTINLFEVSELELPRKIHHRKEHEKFADHFVLDYAECENEY